MRSETRAVGVCIFYVSYNGTKNKPNGVPGVASRSKRSIAQGVKGVLRHVSGAATIGGNA
ncbi:hypothetical protein BHMPCIPO_04764 [Ensifer sesbaniae]|nr:hypothetical protein [Ensifer sesbaniae]